MNFDLNEEQVLLQKSVRDFCEKAIIPNARRWDEEETFPHDLIPAMGEMGLFGMQIPEPYGGAGMKFLDYVVALEEVARADASVGLTMASHNSLCTGHIFLAASEEQRRRYLPRLASGKALGGWGLTEPGSGSDAGAARARAEKRGDKWIVNGTKTFITQGSVGSVYVVLASTAPELKAKGLTAFIIERGTPGFRTGKRIEKMGLHASDTTELVMEDVELPDEQRLGAVNQGFFDTLKILDRGRIGIGSWAVGIGRAALEASKRYAKERVQFNKPIAEFQAIQFMLADMATELDAARLLVWRAAWMQDRKVRTTLESSVGKYFAARAAMRACNNAIQIHGGYGYTREFDVERYLRDAKLAEIGEGTNEVQKMVIAREILKASAGH
ncbi:MAG TPA: acyl-CoA dehydrogenase family protein [Polyangia bacterium]|jgi:alkylation response protein AidB-like acyl-CoA dehydrogenase|nr:acyl-CoA dehydrogenase family protein [Polyangia bacterium]